MHEGKLEITLLKEILKLKGFKNEGIIVSGEVGLDSALIDIDKAKLKAQQFYEDTSEPLLVVKSDPITFPTIEPGKYAVIINANDIACVGGVPFGFLSTIILPPNTSFESVKKIQEQIHLQCLEMEISILGGHTEISNSVINPIVSGSMFGFVPVNYYVESSLREGNVLLSIGYVGAEGTGIIIQEAGNLIHNILDEKELTEGKNIGKQLSISKIALELNKNFKPSLIHDATEGGFYGALSELISFKEVGILLNKQPILSSVTQKLSDWLSINPYRLISSGLILVVIDKKEVEAISKYLNQKNLPFSVIGEVTNEKGVLRFNDEILEKPKSDEIILALQNLGKIKNE